MDMDAQARSLVTPLLRAGESIMGVGFVSNVIPLAARLVPLLVSAYVGHYVAVATDQRLFLLPARLDLLFGKPVEVFAPQALELADLASAETFSPTIIGHSAIRLIGKDGFQRELMWPASKDNVPHHGAFATGFPPWLAGALAQGTLVAGAPDPRAPPPPPISLRAYKWLQIVPSIFAALAVAWSFLAPSLLVINLTVALVLVAIAVIGTQARRDRERRLALEPAARVAWAQQHGPPKSIGKPLLGVVVGGVLLLPVAFFVNMLFQRTGADEAPKSAKSAKGAKDDDEVKPTKTKTAKSKAATPPAATVESPIGLRVTAVWPKDGKRYPGKVKRTYGKFAFVVFDDPSAVWAEGSTLVPALDDPPEPKDDDCGVKVGARVKAPFSVARTTLYPGKVDRIYHQLVHVAFDDGDTGWAECSEIKR